MLAACPKQTAVGRRRRPHTHERGAAAGPLGCRCRCRRPSFVDSCRCGVWVRTGQWKWMEDFDRATAEAATFHPSGRGKWPQPRPAAKLLLALRCCGFQSTIDRPHHKGDRRAPAPFAAAALMDRHPIRGSGACGLHHPIKSVGAAAARSTDAPQWVDRPIGGTVAPPRRIDRGGVVRYRSKWSRPPRAMGWHTIETTSGACAPPVPCSTRHRRRPAAALARKRRSRRATPCRLPCLRPPASVR